MMNTYNEMGVLVKFSRQMDTTIQGIIKDGIITIHLDADSVEHECIIQDDLTALKNIEVKLKGVRIPHVPKSERATQQEDCFKFPKWIRRIFFYD